MMNWIRDTINRMLGGEKYYNVTITYQYTDEFDSLTSAANLKALDPADAVLKLLLSDRNDLHGPETGWKKLLVTVN